MYLRFWQIWDNVNVFVDSEYNFKSIYNIIWKTDLFINFN
jgi:hypothetical protein